MPFCTLQVLQSFHTYADDFEGNENSLFLAEMNRGKKYSVRSKLLFFRDVYELHFQTVCRWMQTVFCSVSSGRLLDN